MNHLIWTALSLIYGVLCGCIGTVIRAWWTRRPTGAGLLDPAALTAMRALRDRHPGEYSELHTAETARTTGRHRLAPEHPEQDGDDHA